jgi:hypothetical protein
MLHGYDVRRPFRKLVMALGLALIITSVSVALIARQVQPALTQALTAGAPTIHVSALTATIPFSERVQGSSRLVYFNNLSAGVLSVTFEISGTPNLSLVAGEAFGDPKRTFTSTLSTWRPVVTYSVEPGGSSYLGVAYTATNTNGVAPTLVISYLRSMKQYLPGVFKNYPPTPTGLLSINHRSASTYNLTATLQITDTTDGDSIAQVRFKNEGGSWEIWQNFETDHSFDLLLSSGNGLKMVHAQLRGAQGGLGEITATILLFENGDFSQHLTTAWQTDNSGLPAASIIDSTTDNTAVDGMAALLGAADPSYGCSNIPLGMSGLSQALQVPSTGGQLKFQYFMITWDGSASGSHAYDAFEVYIDAELKYDDANRNPTLTNCNTPWRVPGPQNPRTETAGWHEAVLDLSAYAGQSITVAFRNYSRFDHYYNTYTYLDNVRLEP